MLNPLGKALRQGDSDVVGVIVPVISNPFYSALVQCLELEVEKCGYKCLIADSLGELDIEEDRMRTLSSRRVRGIFVVPAYFDLSANIVKEISAQIPVIQVDRRVSDEYAAPFVGIDNEDGIAKLLAHLKGQGVKTATYVGADNRTSAGRERRSALEQLAPKYGIQLTAHVLNRFLFSFGFEAVSTILSRGELPDALIGADDLIATGLLAGLAEHNLMVPRDVVVTGFDGTLLSEVSVPRLTCIKQPLEQIAEAAVAALESQRLRPGQHNWSTTVKGTLQIGGSTARSS
ncbi:MAG: substrate-binding domain-containing protein [Winkia neuii]|uniref:LacI family DNA-binding transcriptional regulator n=1 Tax=Winkia neuii TaxID=33007 RepID=UPI000462949A|nr:substrate-binding domain-containing protein [Winkia neuii]OFJ70956.1 hypothetical protein HMPREF2851_08650 [Actinomyces sp. HMSC064C12]OFK03114.1 hypothetical protein HMPREF2835_05350 [Actinomyces sp. HMSC072A03]OFT56525.1 hypothetical protein HMPREF3152_01510 [Actinomyces sp. HMSC06A08]KWZ72215.1 sugar-binding domain protein [Winkia neuii]MDK8100386.1 substrate-binding domain-containing protein [Winkia neuii]